MKVHYDRIIDHSALLPLKHFINRSSDKKNYQLKVLTTTRVQAGAGRERATAHAGAVGTPRWKKSFIPMLT